MKLLIVFAVIAAAVYIENGFVIIDTLHYRRNLENAF